ncbi:uncharacterized protein LOC124887837 [Capsicum annuum]|uniref:uncharacterized protein LOC124887837 n=1 Tax=Capsicum annuum TaxID=4072 RepID=UPI001FB144B4|nr:uncharacterized protein LOC124887837 [Capsicum annuum]
MAGALRGSRVRQEEREDRLRVEFWNRGTLQGSDRRRTGVGILVDEELRGAYVPQVGLEEEVKVRFGEALDEVVSSVPSSEKIVIAGDFNGHIGVLLRGFDDVHGGFDFGVRNDEGAALLDFTRAFGLVW